MTFGFGAGGGEDACGEDVVVDCAEALAFLAANKAARSGPPPTRFGVEEVVVG